MSENGRVGYGRPPVANQFQKGASGNPAGRRRGSRNLATMVKAALHETVVVNVNGKRRKVTKLEAAFIQQSNKAAAGDAKAMKLMLDVLVGAETRETSSASQAGAPTPEARREHHARVLEALKARFIQGGDDDDQAD